MITVNKGVKKSSKLRQFNNVGWGYVSILGEQKLLIQSKWWPRLYPKAKMGSI